MSCQDNKSGESLSSLISLPRDSDFKFIFTLRRNAWFPTQLVAYFMFLVIVPAIVSSLAFSGCHLCTARTGTLAAIPSTVLFFLVEV